MDPVQVLSSGSEEEEDESTDADESSEEDDTDEDDSAGTRSPMRHLLNPNDVVSVDESDGRNVAPKGNSKITSHEVAAAAAEEEEEDEELNMGEIDGICCPICFEAWSSDGDHHVCCLPCGHIYGLSCIKKWLRRPGSSKCPQCKRRSSLKDIRLLYASRIVAVDDQLQKKVRSLEAKCVSLEKKNAALSMKESESKKRESDLSKEVRHLKIRKRDLEAQVKDLERKVSGSTASSSHCHGEVTLGNHAVPNFQMQGCSNKFIIQKDIQVDGGRLFDIDSSSQTLLIARRRSRMGGVHVLTKMSFLNNEMEDIQLPLATKAVKDLRVSPHSKLVLLSSLAKKLSVLSTESYNTIINYDLPAAAWSCSWDISSSHYVYAGLQNGELLQFDLRHTLRPVESLVGLTRNPIHSLESLPPDISLTAGMSSVLTASAIGLCQWKFGAHEERPYLIPDSDNQGVCISLAFSPTSNDIVASYRPKIEMFGDLENSQPILTAASTVCGQGVQGSHVHYKKEGCRFKELGATVATVSNLLLPKSAIVEGLSENACFASADEATCELVLQELPSLRAVGHFKPWKYPVHDVKYSRMSSSGLLGCLSEGSLQIFTAKLF